MGLPEGMRELLARRRELVNSGAVPLGWKVGINVPEVQRRLGINSPVVGYLTDDNLAEPGSTVSLDGWVRPMLEAEIAIRVGPDGEPAALAPAIELVDITLPFEDIEAILVRNVFHRVVVFGDETPGADASGLTCRIMVDGDPRAEVQVDLDPAAALAETRRFLRAFGADLQPGERLIAGSLAAPLPVEPGQRVDVEIGRLGSLRLALMDDAPRP